MKLTIKFKILLIKGVIFSIIISFSSVIFSDTQINITGYQVNDGNSCQDDNNLLNDVINLFNNDINEIEREIHFRKFIDNKRFSMTNIEKLIFSGTSLLIEENGYYQTSSMTIERYLLDNEKKIKIKKDHKIISINSYCYHDKFTLKIEEKHNGKANIISMIFSSENKKN